MTDIPADFVDDGCTDWFDFGGDACRYHDYAYCTRCHPPGSMTYAAKIRADQKLRDTMWERLPWYLRWTAWLVYDGVFVGGPFNAWDSCGAEAGERCRHNVPMPDWMKETA